MANPVLQVLVKVMTGKAMTEWYIQPSTYNDSLSHECSVSGSQPPPCQS